MNKIIDEIESLLESEDFDGYLDVLNFINKKYNIGSRNIKKIQKILVKKKIILHPAKEQELLAELFPFKSRLIGYRRSKNKKHRKIIKRRLNPMNNQRDQIILLVTLGAGAALIWYFWSKRKSDHAQLQQASNLMLAGNNQIPINAKITLDMIEKIFKEKLRRDGYSEEYINNLARGI